MNKVAMQLADKALRQGGILLFRKMDALEFVQGCKIESVVILGIDSFIITETTIPDNRREPERPLYISE